MVRVKECIFDFHPTEFNSISENAKDLIKCLLIKDPESRFSAAEALKHPWFSSNEALEEVQSPVIDA